MRLALGKKEFMCLVVLETGTDNLAEFRIVTFSNCGIYLHLGNNETRKRKEQRLIFKLGTLAPNGINERFSFA